MCHQPHRLEGLTAYDVGRYLRFTVEVAALILRFLVILLVWAACLFACLMLLRLLLQPTITGPVVVVSDR
jgi:hypothetical protein